MSAATVDFPYNLGHGEVSLLRKELMHQSLEVVGRGELGPVIVGIKLHESLAFDFKPRRHRGLINIAHGAEVIIGKPLPELHLRMAHHRRGVKAQRHILYLRSLWRFLRERGHDSGVEFLSSERHNHTMSHRRSRRHPRGHTVCERCVERQRQHYFYQLPGS